MKKIGILGTGMVGSTIATKMFELGYDVKMGSRSATNEKALEWVVNKGAKASVGTFDEVAAFGEIVFICLKGEAVLPVIKMLKTKLSGKIVVDISNPLDFSKGMPPFLIPELTNTNSLGEEVQKALPDSYVVKTLNTVSALIMVAAAKPGGAPSMFLSGNNRDAKQEITALLKLFGWEDIIDLGDITTARGTEMLLPIWLRTMFVFGHANFAFKVLR
ncbi:MAG: NAD(P)-binding domain-containing protein [Bacteroidota bacterium]|nr:NAD(P)-binding domain-containing protein [Bacteroidota bacterium]